MGDFADEKGRPLEPLVLLNESLRLSSLGRAWRRRAARRSDRSSWIGGRIVDPIDREARMAG
jgi:hypothetical protein